MVKQQTTHILLVEDNQDHAALIARHFARSRDQVELVVVDTVAAARASLTDSSPSVVLCDYLLPDGTGLEILHSHIEGVPLAPSFVLLTSQGDEMVAVQAMKAGATDYIIKSEASLSTLPEICRAIAREGEQRREKVRTQRELSEKQSLNEMLLAALPHPAMLIRGTERTVVAANEKALECGARIGDRCWRSFARRTLHPAGPGDREADGPCSICRGDECLFSGEEQNDPEVQTVDKVYDVYWIKVSEDLFLHYVIDITERQKLQRDLVQMSREQSATLSAASVGIGMVKNRVLLWGNRALGEIFGYGPEELRNVDTRLLYCSQESYQHTGQEAYASLAECSNYSANLEMRRKDGSGVWIQLQGRAIDQESSVWVFQDITRHRMLEEQLHQSQKVEAIGQLAGGIAHDFNNILTVIIGYCALLEADQQLGEQQREAVEQIMNSSEKAAQLTRGLLAFSRKQVIALNKANLNDIVQRTQKLLCRIIGEDIQFKLRLCEPDLPVKVDTGQIEQVLINLATNARDAMPRGGTLTIETALIAPQLLVHPGPQVESPLPLACISVSDTGNGMDEQTRCRIFEPFFTTKEVGKGTGLGMSIVYGIVQQHGGLIEVASTPGEGTKISLYLPLAGEGDRGGTAAAASREVRGGSETILLGEDDPGVRKLVSTALATYGYRVIEAYDGQDAVDKFTQHQGEIDFILMDMIMPKRSGRDAYEEIVRIKPGVKVLFLSGYTADFIKGKGLIAEEGVELVMKPVQPMDLLAKIRQILDAQS